LSAPNIDNRRQSPRHQTRHEVCLQASISLLDAQASVSYPHEKLFTIFGSTHDLSEAGVSLVIPLIPIDVQYCQGQDHVLPLTLYLPSGEVEMKIAPVRCAPLDEKELGEGFFMGAQIKEIDLGELERLIEYLQTIS
jgi:hypothetical protein